MTKPTVKGGLAPANAVEVKGRVQAVSATSHASGLAGWPRIRLRVRRLRFTVVRLKLHKAHCDAL